MKHGVMFEVEGVKKHSSDFNLEFVSYDLRFPEPKTNYVEVLGRNGSIDLTDVLGRVYYKNRTITLNFNSLCGFNQTIKELVRFLHGKKTKITIYDDENYHYISRVTFDKYSSDYTNGKVILKCDCEPFKLKSTLTINKQVVTNGKVVIYKNNHMETTPSFKSDAPVNFEFNNTKYSIISTEPIIFANIEFKQGDNSIKWLGSANVEVSYQEGDF